MKQPEDIHTADLLEPQDLRLNIYRNAMQSIELNIIQGLANLDLLHREKTEIEKLGYTFGTIHYKAGKYAYLIQPQQDGERIREYIGADLQKIEKAQERIERAERHRDLQQQISNINNRFWDLTQQIENTERKAKRLTIDYSGSLTR